MVFDNDGAIYYFGYGPIVNPMVRRRRQMNTGCEQAAVLPDHRMTFAFGGIANVVPQRGYEVHGVLMRFDCEDDWIKFQEYDVGYNEMTVLDVYTYDALEEGPPQRAYCLTMSEFDESQLDGPPEQLPQERYLKLISTGLRAYNADNDFVEDQILNVPYELSRKPEEYQAFPKRQEKLPKITYRKYERLCKKPGEVYFILNGKVLRLGPHDPENPGAMWFRNNLHGEEESTLIIHCTIVEPSLPIVDKREDLSPEHHAWVEDHLVQFLEKCNLSATKIFEIREVPKRGVSRSISPWLFRRFSRTNDRGLSNESSTSEEKENKEGMSGHSRQSACIGMDSYTDAEST